MLHELLECLDGTEGPRAPARVEHRLIDVPAIAVCAALAKMLRHGRPCASSA